MLKVRNETMLFANVLEKNSCCRDPNVDTFGLSGTCSNMDCDYCESLEINL